MEEIASDARKGLPSYQTLVHTHKLEMYVFSFFVSNLHKLYMTTCNSVMFIHGR